ncbi:unnamed protein product [Aphanomyces euteiches]|uniref:Peptidase S1 domain-containing protein n=1 Tax=Aphanomyces euteiches TaxID=100861 RepID=A0A6G0WDS8_9STRA|nr:hypothetical protein Ae201684_016045 [Aphanomyces euteiches]KAH9078735.1 hypothetical protein Ae201684P_019809 [Aphanomyces euteiches]KAH9138392.1 hypothetical protein AeRB84_017290 [Aphanomyces euteiches]
MFALVLSLTALAVVQAAQMEELDVVIPSPPIVSLYRFKNGPNDCTGVLITPEYVLTAAGCVNNTKWAVIRSNDTVEHVEINSGRAHREVATTDVSTKYGLGVLHLRNTSKQTPAKLNFTTLIAGLEVWRKGFSHAYSLDDSSPPRISESSGHVIQSETCNDVSGSPNAAAIDSLVCISGPRPCNGDTGGPVTTVQDGQHVVVALTIWTNLACTSSISGYARLSTAREFIEPYLVPPLKDPQLTPMPSQAKCPMPRPSLT